MFQATAWDMAMGKAMVGGAGAMLLGAAALAGCSGGDSGGGGSGTVVTPATPTEAGAPGAPTIGTATAGDGSATIAFTAPASNGGAAITGYVASCTGAGVTRSANGTASPISVSGLSNGTSYSCTVTATNSAGTSAASAAVSVTPSASATGSGTSTAAVLCPYSGSFTGSYGGAGTLTATWSWTCASGRRSLTGNGLPDHAVGTFPNSANPNQIRAQLVLASMTLTPSMAGSDYESGPGRVIGYALNSVKFDPGTAGTCAGSATRASDCNLANGTDTWKIEALGQSVFDFGLDANNAHVQPTGEYHYHGMPEGMLTAAGASSANPRMVLVGWASDGYPVYARYCYSVANDARSAVKICTGSYTLDTSPDAGRPATSWVPLGAFQSDWNYTAGSGDLDNCNGRTGVTPEFPNGIYYYMVTDSYPYFGRCLKGNVQ